mmetsp:Transcript_47205/g.106981  ORF Transcript_47205/g.106981 Transcript_47205/m.106981 type:complete len:258 (+) Transcript_47205:1748-2521(+)
MQERAARGTWRTAKTSSHTTRSWRAPPHAAATRSPHTPSAAPAVAQKHRGGARERRDHSEVSEAASAKRACGRPYEAGDDLPGGPRPEVQLESESEEKRNRDAPGVQQVGVGGRARGRGVLMEDGLALCLLRRDNARVGDNFLGGAVAPLLARFAAAPIFVVAIDLPLLTREFQQGIEGATIRGCGPPHDFGRKKTRRGGCWCHWGILFFGASFRFGVCLGTPAPQTPHGEQGDARRRSGEEEALSVGHLQRIVEDL